MRCVTCGLHAAAFHQWVTAICRCGQAGVFHSGMSGAGVNCGVCGVSCGVSCGFPNGESPVRAHGLAVPGHPDVGVSGGDSVGEVCVVGLADGAAASGSGSVSVKGGLCSGVVADGVCADLPQDDAALILRRLRLQRVRNLAVLASLGSSCLAWVRWGVCWS